MISKRKLKINEKSIQVGRRKQGKNNFRVARKNNII